MKALFFMAILTFLLFPGCRKSDYFLEDYGKTITDSGRGTGNVTWTKDGEYILEGFVFVNDGQTLTIEPGTVVRFKPGEGENASALIVARGGKIIAAGTRDEPIIFTAEADDLKGSVSLKQRALWGGLVILGNAPLNVEGGEASIDGIPYAEPRGTYGGFDINDNSGILKYVSIRHGGTNIGDGNEINGLTLGGVGNKTEIDYVEIISNEDDGVEIFGGTVNLKHMVVSGCGDDAFDYDLGWNGNGQFWLAVQSPNLGDNLVEAGGGISPVNGQPYSLPNIYNGTFIGNGNSGEGSSAVFKNFAGGLIANSMFLHNNRGIFIEVTDSYHDCYTQWKLGNLDLRNNIFYDVAGFTPESVFGLTGIFSADMLKEWQQYFFTGGNLYGDPLVDFENGIFLPLNKIEGQLYPIPESWFQIVDFKGAFGESNWIDGWTLLAE